MLDPGWYTPVPRHVVVLTRLPEHILVGVQKSVDTLPRQVTDQSLKKQKMGMRIVLFLEIPGAP